MRTIQKVTGYRGINKIDNKNLNAFISKILLEYSKLPKQMMLEFPVIMQMAEHRVENLRIIQGWKEIPEDRILKLSRSAFREGFLAGVERVRMIKAKEVIELRNQIQSISKGLDGPEKSG